VRQAEERRRTDMSRMRTSKSETSAMSRPGSRNKEPRKAEPVRVEKKVGRNDPCPCGSGKKFKSCHGKGQV